MRKTRIEYGPMHARFLVALAAIFAGACSAAPTGKSAVADALTAMGGDKVKAVQTISMKGGSGTRTRLQEQRRVTDPEEPATLKNVVEIVDVAGGRASLDYEVNEGGFIQHRHEVLTTRGGKPVGVEYVDMRPVIATSPGGLFSWGTQNSPEITLHRNILAILMDAAGSAPDAAPDDSTFAGKMTKHTTAKTKNGDDLSLYFDPQTRLLAGFETTDTEALDGDVPAQYVFADYRDVGGVKLPHKITVRKAGKDYSDVQYTSAAVNDAAAQKEFEIPDSASKQADTAIAAGEYSPIEISKIADGVYFAKAYSHNSMVVEFPEWLAVVEAPYTDTQSQTLVRVLKEQFPDKPIRYAAVTHHHSDHIGGVRGLAAAGATILAERGHAAAILPLLDRPHTHPPDSLEAAKSSGTKVGRLEIFETMRAITDGKQTLALFAFTGSPHAEPMVMAYVPNAKVLFQSDLWFPATGGSGNPAAKQLYDSIKALKLDVKTNVGGHGGVGPFAELENAVKVP
jgi:glyoxylase-like metal-dependent hydrolase (beta-lactamase superfamily II)